MSLIAKAQVLQHRRMEALRKYVEDVEDIDRRRDELDLATTRAWVKVVHAGWATTDLAGLGLKAPKKTRTRSDAPTDSTADVPAARVEAAPPSRGDDSDG